MKREGKEFPVITPEDYKRLEQVTPEFDTARETGALGTNEDRLDDYETFAKREMARPVTQEEQIAREKDWAESLGESEKNEDKDAAVKRLDKVLEVRFKEASSRVAKYAGLKSQLDTLKADGEADIKEAIDRGDTITEIKQAYQNLLSNIDALVQSH